MDQNAPLLFSQPREATIEHLRAAAAARVDHTSLRGVAREIGMSPTGLKKFLLGTAPYSPTLRRLRKWYIHHAALPAGELGYEDAAAAIAVLTHDLPGEPRRDAAHSLLDCLARSYDDAGRTHPAWMQQLRADLGERRPG